MGRAVKKALPIRWQELTAAEDNGIGITLDDLLTVKTEGITYGAKLITLIVFGCAMPAVAMRAGDAKWVTTPDDAIGWLSGHGMTDDEAERLMRAVTAYGCDK
jgi:hypothetical protein